MGDSSWQDKSLKTVKLSRRERDLISRLRRLGEGTHLAVILRRAKGRQGLESFRVQENIPVLNGEEKPFEKS